MTESQESVNPEFITLDEAAAMTSGTRVTFVPGVQAMYSEAVSYTHLTLPTTPYV